MVEDEIGASSTTPPIQRLTELLEDQCPVYMAMGMSYDDYWNGPLEMAKFYRESFKLQKKQMNERLWLQGMYIYRALENLHPLFNAWSEAQQQPYLEKPIPLTQAEAKQDEEEKAKKEMEDMRDYLERQMLKPPEKEEAK